MVIVAGSRLVARGVAGGFDAAQQAGTDERVPEIMILGGPE